MTVEHTKCSIPTRRISGLVMTFLLAASLITITSGPVAAGEQSFTPTDDTYSREGIPDANYGSDGTMSISQSVSWEKRTFIRFDISALPAGATIDKVELRLRRDIRGSGQMIIEVWSVDNDDWLEGELTWNYKPDIVSVVGSKDVSDLVGAGSGWTSIVVNTDFIQSEFDGDKIVSISLRKAYAGEAYVYINSKEWSGLANGPHLDIEYNTVAPNVPTNLLPTGEQLTPVTISCVVTDNDGHDINVYFYDNSDSSLIDNIWIESGQTAQVIWNDLTKGQTYAFFVRAQDELGYWSENSDTQSFWVSLRTEYRDTWQVNQSSDDAYRRLEPEAWSATSTIFAGDRELSAYDYRSGIRFTNINIPKGWTISSAYLHLKAYSSKTTIAETIIRGEAADNSITFSTAADFDARARTDASVDWTPEAWIGKEWYTSSDIKAIIQEIVYRDGWSSGNAIVIFWEDELGWDVADRIEAYSYDYGYAPKLEITWRPPKPTKPILYEPDNNATLLVSTPYFEWTNGDYADNHRLLVDNNSDFSSPEVDINLIDDNSYTTTTELPNGSYSWKVIAQNADGENASDVWTFILSMPVPPDTVLDGSEQAAPSVVIRITAGLKANSIIENVVATLGIDNTFSFLADYPESVDMGNFSVGETKTVEWMLATPLVENVYSYDVSWYYEYDGENRIISDNASIDVSVPPLFDFVAAAMFVFPLVLMGIAFAFDNVVFASFAGAVFILSGLFFVDIIWLSAIFVGIGVYLLITAFMGEEEGG